MLTKIRLPPGRQPKELAIIDGASHVDFYDRDQYLTPTVAKLKVFFDKALGS
jgi:hypothetical protein